jgi:hypothetical protein
VAGESNAGVRESRFSGAPAGSSADWIVRFEESQRRHHGRLRGWLSVVQNSCERAQVLLIFIRHSN